jgi:hypothetical protein
MKKAGLVLVALRAGPYDLFPTQSTHRRTDHKKITLRFFTTTRAL